jgi:indole-3-acetate monooxygenase
LFDMELVTDTDLLKGIRDVGALIREYADEAERGRRLTRPVMEALASTGLLRLYVPRSLGGLEVDPVTCAQGVEEVSSFDPTAGWMAMVTGSVDWLCACLPDEGVEEIYADGASTVLAGAAHPPMRALPTEGGYRVTGRCPLVSGCHEARWFFFTALVEGEDGASLTVNGAPEVIGVVINAEEGTILDTWYALGMRSSDSNDVE